MGKALVSISLIPRINTSILTGLLCTAHSGVKQEKLPSVTRLIALLRVSKHWGVSSVEALSLHALERHPDFDHTLRFPTACQLDVRRWYSHSAAYMLTGPPLARKQIRLLNNNTLYILLYFKHSVDLERAKIALDRPILVPCDDCPAPSNCRQAWEDIWKVVMPEFLYVRCSLLGCTDNLRSRVAQSSMCLGCIRRTLILVQKSGTMKREEQRVNFAVQQMYNAIYK